MPRSRRPPLQQTMLGHITGYWTAQLVFVAAKLGIADALAKGPLTADALAKRVGAHAPSLRRVLRALAAHGIFKEGPGGRFRLTPLAETLRGDRPGSLRSFALMMVDGYNWHAWGALEHSVRTGEPAFDRVHGVPVFRYLEQHPEEERAFAASMASISGTENAAIARAYPFARLRRLVDVGGAHGHLLATILRRHRRLHGVLYDQPQVVRAAAESGFLSAPEISGRCETIGGSFFDSVPAGADGYIMKYIIHDWDDDRCIRILSNCRDAMAQDAKVLIVEHVISPGNAPDWGKQLDMNMLALTGGRERTREEFRDLLARAGLALRRVLPTACPLGIVEATRA
jgi:hypothetical protein